MRTSAVEGLEDVAIVAAPALHFQRGQDIIASLITT